MLRDLSNKYAILHLILFILFSSSHTSIGHCAELIEGPHNHTAIYGSSELMKKHQKEIASQYSIIITEWWKHREVAAIKRINPHIKILFYRDLIGMRTDYEDWIISQKHPDWFVVEENSKARIQHDKFGWFLMDCTNKDYRKHLISYLESKLEQYPVFDGVFLDDAIQSLNPIRFRVQGSGQHPAFSQQFLSSYQTGIEQLLQELQSRKSGKMVVINTNSADYCNYADGVMFEGFVHGTWQTEKFKPRIQEWMSDIKKLESFIQTNKYVLVHSGIKGSLREQDDTFLFTYTSYLLFHGPKTTFCYEATSEKNSLPSFDKYMYDLGKPLEAMQTHLIRQNIYAPESEFTLYTRRFENGMVFVNPNSQPIEYDLPVSYFDTDEHIIKHLTIPNQSGYILLKSIIPKPPMGLSIELQTP